VQDIPVQGNPVVGCKAFLAQRHLTITLTLLPHLFWQMEFL
jgi:hypothetical protein